MKSLILFPVFFCFVISCSVKKEKEVQDYILTEKDLIPEGVAFDKTTQTIYVSSTHKRKIVQINKDGEIRDFISEGQDSIKSVIGMEVDNTTNSLWVVSSEAHDVLPIAHPGPGQWRSSVYRFNLADGKMTGKYVLDKDSVFLNDLAVGPDGTVYITETMQHTVYRIKPGQDSLQVFIQPAPFTFLNGICFADKKDKLFVCSTEGIIAIDLSSGKYSLLPAPASINHTDIDGLSFTGNYFIGHQSTKVCRFYTNTARDSITRSDTLNTGKEFDSSTTGEIGEGYYYFIVNSQVRSGIDFAKKAIKPADSLEHYIIRKIKLE